MGPTDMENPDAIGLGLNFGEKVTEATHHPKAAQHLRVQCLEMALRVDLHTTAFNSHVALAREFEQYVTGENQEAK